MNCLISLILLFLAAVLGIVFPPLGLILLILALIHYGVWLIRR